MRGTLVAKIKENVFMTFKDKLMKINTNASPNMIIGWKKSEAVKNCFNLLHEKHPELSGTYFESILKQTFPKKSPGRFQKAFVNAVVTLILDPESDTIQIKENLIKKQMNLFLVTIYVFNSIIFVYCI